MWSYILRSNINLQIINNSITSVTTFINSTFVSSGRSGLDSQVALQPRPQGASSLCSIRWQISQQLAHGKGAHHLIMKFDLWLSVCWVLRVLLKGECDVRIRRSLPLLSFKAFPFLSFHFFCSFILQWNRVKRKHGDSGSSCITAPNQIWKSIDSGFIDSPSLSMQADV